MVLVVIGHVLMNCNPANGQTLLQNIIGTFYMPLFFLISGFFAFKKSSRWTCFDGGGFIVGTGHNVKKSFKQPSALDNFRREQFMPFSTIFHAGAVFPTIQG